MPVLPVRSPEPVISPGTTSTTAVEHLLRSRRASRSTCPACARRQLLLPAARAPRPERHASYSSARSGFAATTSVRARSHASRAARRGARPRGSSASTSSGTKKSWSAGRPRISLTPRDLVGAERVAVRLRGVLELRRRVADVRAQHDERRPVAPRPCRRAGRASSASRSSATSPSSHDVPAVRRRSASGTSSLYVELGRRRRS